MNTRFGLALTWPLGLIAIGLMSCTSPKEKPAPAEPLVVPKSVVIKDPNTPDIPNAPARGVKKSLFHVVVTPGQLFANGTPVKDLNALIALLKTYNRPVVTMAVHRCVQSQFAKDVLNSAQALTNTPIAYSAYGDYTDAVCKKP